MSDLDALKYFLSAYFHQDWRGEHPTPSEVVDAFARNENEEQRLQVCADIAALKAEGLNDVALGQHLRKLGSAYDPTRDGIAWSDWLDDVGQRIRPL